MAEVAGARFAFSDESVVIQVYYDDVTGHPTRVTSSNDGSALEVTYTVASGDRVFTGTRTVPTGSEDYSIPNGLASRVNFLTDDAYLSASHRAV